MEVEGVVISKSGFFFKKTRTYTIQLKNSQDKIRLYIPRDLANYNVGQILQISVKEIKEEKK